MSEKVYILFFSRTNQRAVSASTALASNGVKSHECNGSEASKISKPSVIMKTAQVKSHVEQPSRKEFSSLSKADKPSLSLRGKSNMNGHSNSVRAPTTINGKIVLEKDQSMKEKENEKENINNVLPLENGARHKSSLGNGNSRKNNEVAEDVTEKEHKSVLMNSNGNGESMGMEAVKHDQYDGSPMSTKFTAGRVSGHDGVDNAVNCPSEIKGSKRKSDFCILLQQDAQSRERVEELKEVYVKDCSNSLQNIYSVNPIKFSSFIL